jgi:hypothetical protein
VAKKGAAVDLVVEIFRDTPSNGEPVECRGAASDFIQDHQALLRGIVENVGRLVHFNHESRLTA